MNLRDLRYLVAVAEHRHFGRAAESCYVSQPTLSTQIKKLEGFLGVQLIERSHKQVMLTPAGRAVVERARKILTEVDDMVELCRAAHTPLGGELRLGLIPTFAPYLLPHLVPALRTELKELRPLLYEDQTARLLERLRHGELDAGMMAMPVEGLDLNCEPLFDEPFVLALPSGHPLADKSEIDLNELKDLKVLLLDEGHCLRDQALDICKMVGASREEEFRATSMETLRQMVASGAGVTLLPALAAMTNASLPNRAAFVLRPFAEPTPKRRMAIYWRKGSAREEAIRAVAEVCRNLPVLDKLASPAELLEEV
ncbi:DNA-binding transcriptional regulator OxyR [Alkalilimnicola ehrlichii]|uniref:DNA-binding transcriptional regulator OxyR n=1 Tax=Alkalilimnicola ehrlichii TaxID=351052 RepID=A0A3E0WYV2_9GAMM|nr:LysR substrate-binding domain-containing protein [Alkalilimnicola ehrlichii]RFA30629.1 DNA-binding transcriptional regulator OxyR [Alkalilimnicola ehrlichii]RFA38210.1 DNA-binding transcriptional regulator OxyR [Alkalilimnicola ehrlichii]